MLSENLHNAHVSISLVTSQDEKNDRWGTAFVFHSDQHYTYLLTCAHVIRDVGGIENALVTSEHVEEIISNDAIDLAVLRTPKGDGAPALKLGYKTIGGGEFLATGFTKLGKDYRKSEIRGTFLNAFQLSARGSRGLHWAWELLTA